MAGRKKMHAKDVCERLQISVRTWRAYVSRGQAPQPDGVDQPLPGTSSVRPWWYERTIDKYEAGRTNVWQVKSGG
jgi:hypothetical protein